MAVEQQISEEAYQQFVLSGVEGSWELHDGRLVEKPGMTWRHGEIPMLLGHFLLSQLDRAAIPGRLPSFAFGGPRPRSSCQT